MGEHDEDIRLTKTEHHALFVLASFNQTGADPVETAKVAKAMGCSEENAREALEGLVEKGLVAGFLDREGRAMGLTPAQQEAVLRAVSEIPWGDTEGALNVIDLGLALAMRASRDEFVMWQEHAEDAGFDDEFTVDDIHEVPLDWRFALVARLLRSIAMAYGVGTDYAEDKIGQVSGDSDAASTPLRAILASLADGSRGRQEEDAE